MSLPGVRPIQILLVEDSPSDAKLTMTALQQARVANEVIHVNDGVEAMEYVRRPGAPLPDLILLDLNLPRKDGREVLAELKADPRLSVIPVVVMTSSQAEEDVLRSYQLHANCYVTKPVNFDRFIDVVHSIERFWLSIVVLPNRQ
jgi:two-component system, chemotaxis family, response regulator Rcp1